MDQPRRHTSTSAQPTASAAVARFAVELFEARGVPCGPILERLGLTRELLRNPDARLPVSTYDALWSEAVRASGDPLSALEVGRQLPLAAYRIVGYSMATAATVREALTLVGEYFALLKGGFALAIRRRHDRELIEYGGMTPGVTLPPEVATAGAAALIAMAETISRRPFLLAEIRFPFPRPPHADRLAAAFGARLAFDSRCVELWPAPGALDAPTAAPDPSLRATFEQLARRALEHDRRARAYRDAVAALEQAVTRARDVLEEQRAAAARAGG